MTVNLLNHTEQLLESEVTRLRKELTHAWALLEYERRKTTELETILEAAVAAGSVPADDPFALENTDDEMSRAFDQFINQPDPHLDKTRRFLLG